MSSVVEGPRAVVWDLVAAVTPFDEREAADRRWMLDWIESDAPLFRTEKPATPPEHLAVYAALVDEDSHSVMLVDHVKAKAWLMPGGHVDPDEDPRQTIVRELDEELRIAPSFHPLTGSAPLFLTVTQTRGAHSHTDVTLWFVFQADRRTPITPDPAEFSAVRWFELDRETGWAAEQFDPQMARFVAKLSQTLDRVTAGS
ncbi:NUDIX domain-containing protein [Actinomadura darangshiensis]|uniref:NUDIX domain-containing protein n=1 Tax=Actinomadura darangshiensis TaxID=705336 RepID=A0A4V2YQL8_9ACTN|nr:NUDIX domain-containing protein [Actinomadura darangshiensis]TDD62597.1 NUDIX domain-containing protein [Actinomadura darangshiensis]